MHVISISTMYSMVSKEREKDTLLISLFRKSLI